jgi:beta-glucosidase
VRLPALLLCCSSLCLAQAKLPYLDTSAPLDQRVNDLVSRMTLEEKISQMTNDAPAIPRLNIPAYNWWNEGLHGVARAGKATSFPEPIGLADTFDINLVSRVAIATSDEARAKYHDFLRRGKHGIYQGLTFWSPNINLFRDPRWGRGMETYGEDPYLTGRMAVAFVRGMQGNDPRYLKTIATPKHFAVHSGPESQRHTYDARITPHDLFDTYLPHFEMAVREGGAQSVMCAYNELDGTPACANASLLTGILRDKWKFDGYVVTDCGAISDFSHGHKFTTGGPAAAAAALKAGTDLDCGHEYRDLLPAVQQKLVTEQQIDTAVRRLFTARFRLGMFDPPEMVPYANISMDVVESSEHRDLALDAARKSIVLLKNANRLLPLPKDAGTIAIIGPNADRVDTLLGNYNGQPVQTTTPLEGIRLRVSRKTKVLYAEGSPLAAGLPTFEIVPTTALFTTTAKSREQGLKGDYYATVNLPAVPTPAPTTIKRKGRKSVVRTIPLKTSAVPVKPLFTRVDANVDFRWAERPPRSDMPDDNFSVRWTGFISAPTTGTYQLGARGLDTFELFFNGQSIAKRSSIDDRGYASAPVQMVAGQLYPIRLEFRQTLPDAEIHLTWAPPNEGLEQAALDVARQADEVVLFLGLSPRLEGEEMPIAVEGFAGGDRVDLGLPKVQQKLLEDVVALKKPTVLVLLNGSALSVNWASDRVPAILESWYPGEAGGAAIADVLFGDYNPAGRLPVTVYQSAAQLPAFDSYAAQGRTYRYFTGAPLYPFGYGLSYTSFTYRNLQFAGTVRAGAKLTVAADVLNSGSAAGEEVIQVYVSHKHVEGAPVRSLAGFFRTRLEPGESKSVEFLLTPQQLGLIDAKGDNVVTPGDVEISVGGKQPGFSGAADAYTTQVLTGTLKLTGETVSPGPTNH